jgi:hypothetical protein
MVALEVKDIATTKPKTSIGELVKSQQSQKPANRHIGPMVLAGQPDNPGHVRTLSFLSGPS